MQEGKQTKKIRTTKLPQRKHHNPWRWAFLILLGIILGSGIFISARVFSTPTNAPKASKVEGAPSLTVSLTRQQVNQLTQHYLNQYLKDSKIKYQFRVEENSVLLVGTVKFLGSSIQFNLVMNAYVQNNGDVQLRAKQLAIGALNVPVNFVMGYIRSAYKLPAWITVNSKDESIMLHLTRFKTTTGFQITAKRLDFAGNQFVFNVYLPD
ncbi:YpmS family protein [Schleiferilactobacillus perolens]|uniref:Extracellular protein n=2 Tax=Schleiferilactobacillus perolens TaxID=100468 RepID=A0A0R1N9B1_9LACO|nr:YpmS family protein [Schleiferilactobacillus perolens]KRL14122.1 extracellular protein precursor [Schleiferilactobacillus perolens DSM 12744]